jgi:hypothetical protein
MLLAQNLQSSPSVGIWKQLAEVVLVQLILFNRRRVGEAERLLLADYAKIDNNPPQEDVLKLLTSVERTLATVMKRIEIRGKRGRKVAMLFPADHNTSLELLSNYRQSAGVSTNNKYVFAKTSSVLNRSVRGCDCLRNFARQCGAEHPEN